MAEDEEKNYNVRSHFAFLHHIGVYEVKIEAEEHKVTVTGNIDCTTLIMKLVKSGKHAEIWAPTRNDYLKDEMYLNQLQSLMEDLDSSESKPPPVYPCDENNPRWEFESYLNNNNRYDTQMDEDFSSWNQDLTNDMGGMKYSTSLPRYYAPGQFDRLKSIHTGFPAYEYQYQLPAVMDNMQGPWYDYPYSMMYTNMPNMHPVGNMMDKMYAFN
ncbi:hypothetical protein DH2020_012486 [Rehmannia glutinosa]|uniref:HMA domain-containing protein n=1 Tax=Rehmannia glutinosa TaxID=99300 RepID=A0ABR0X2L4_REHGL